jgi:hypothetical protein
LALASTTGTASPQEEIAMGDKTPKRPPKPKKPKKPAV